MDTYEEKDNLPNPEQETVQAEQPFNTEEATDGFYHGVGVQEVTYVSAPPTENGEEPQNNDPVQAPCCKRKRKKRGLGKKILKIAVAAVLIIALVSAACGLSIVVTNRHWQIFTQNLMHNFEQQIQVPF